MIPETRYTKVGDVHIAYQVTGDGPRDLVIVPGIYTHLEEQWTEPSSARFLGRLASFSRLILFDPRGTGLSDRAPELPLLEEQMDDVNAVLDAVGSRRAAILGISQGGPMAALYAATYPPRTTALMLYGSYAVVRADEDFPWGRDPAWLEEWGDVLDRQWGTGALLDRLAPSRAGDPAFRRWWSRFERYASAPGNALAYFRMNVQIDIRSVLPTIGVPTLVLHREGDAFRGIETSRYLADRIPGARMVPLPGEDHIQFVGDQDALLGEIEEFLTGSRPSPEPARVLVTVLFLDIVGSTDRATELGDRDWRSLLERFRGLVRTGLERHRGREVDTAGDGFLAIFDGPARAVRAALAVRGEVRALGLEVRAGLHTGEVEVMGDGVAGIAVHIAARVVAEAAPSEVLVSRTVTDLVAGSGLEFVDRGERSLKGIPGSWMLYAASDERRY